MLLIMAPLVMIARAANEPSPSCADFQSPSQQPSVAPRARPWMVLLWISEVEASGDASTRIPHTCEGALIRPDWVLTAASCFPCRNTEATASSQKNESASSTAGKNAHTIDTDAVSVVADIGLYSSDFRKEIARYRSASAGDKPPVVERIGADAIIVPDGYSCSQGAEGM